MDPARPEHSDLGVRLDASFARSAVGHLRRGSPSVDELAALPAVAHLLRHARQFEIDVPAASGVELVRHLLGPVAGRDAQIARVQESLRFFTETLATNRAWVEDALYYLPENFRFDGSLYLTYGYDIGVALAPDASLNAAHPRFGDAPRELLYYAIHELHHVGYMRYQPPPLVAEIETCADVLQLVRYCTHLEGMAVLAAGRRRRAERALDADEDYVALADETRMRAAEASYFEAVDCLARRADTAADDEAFAVLERMSSGERLWYRVGARLAQRIEDDAGHAALVRLVAEGPDRFAQASPERLGG
jgi:hypothetical protein